MGFESSATYINQLVPTNPSDTLDYISGGDDHLRLIKATLQNTFPRITGPVPITQDDLSKVDYLMDAGITNAIAVSPVTAWAAYSAGKGFFVKVQNTNTGNTTAKVGSLSPVNILDNGGNALNAGTLIAGSIHQLIYDGTNFRVATNNSITRNSQIALNPYSSVDASIANTRTGTLTLGTNGQNNIVLNANGSVTIPTLSITTGTIPTANITTLNVSGSTSAVDINSTGAIVTTGGSITARTTNPTINLRDTNNRSVSLYADAGHFYILRTNGNDSVTNEMPATGFWGFDHDIDLGKTTFGNDVTVRGLLYVANVADASAGTVHLGTSGTRHIGYYNSYYNLPNADLKINGKRALKHANDTFGEEYYVPKFVGSITNLASAPAWTGSSFNGAPTTVRNSTGIYTVTFPNISIIHGVNIIAGDANSTCHVNISAKTGNTFTCKTVSAAGTAFDPDIGLYLTVYGI